MNNRKRQCPYCQTGSALKQHRKCPWNQTGSVRVPSRDRKCILCPQEMTSPPQTGRKLCNIHTGSVGRVTAVHLETQEVRLLQAGSDLRLRQEVPPPLVTQEVPQASTGSSHAPREEVPVPLVTQETSVAATGSTQAQAGSVSAPNRDRKCVWRRKEVDSSFLWTDRNNNNN